LHLWISAASGRTKNPEELKQIKDLLAKILKIMPESWLPELDAKVDAHLSAHPVRP
jgi:hypothetical protein